MPTSKELRDEATQYRSQGLDYEAKQADRLAAMAERQERMDGDFQLNADVGKAYSELESSDSPI